MPVNNPHRLETLIAAALFGLSVSIVPVLAAGDISPPSSPPPTSPPPAAHHGKSSQKRKQHDQRSLRGRILADKIYRCLRSIRNLGDGDTLIAEVLEHQPQLTQLLKVGMHGHANS